MTHDKRGMLSMVNKGKDTNGSQFFITLKATDWLDGYNVIFGEMISGENTLRVLEVGGSKSGRTTSEFKISKCGIVDKKAESSA